jgi:Ran GTPase-activating protein (RanGAP) involved in mRNA processing and transport
MSRDPPPPTNPYIASLCERLRANDPSLTSLSFGRLPLFRVTAADSAPLLQALGANTTVTELDLSLDENNVADAHDHSTSEGELLRHVLSRADCPVQSLIWKPSTDRLWTGMCAALAQNKSVRQLEVGTAASVFSSGGEIPVLKEKACQELAMALSSSHVEGLSLRGFQLTVQGLRHLVPVMVSLKRVELHQISTEAPLYEYLDEVVIHLEELSLVECRSTADTGLSSPRRVSTATTASPAKLARLRIAQCPNQDLALGFLRFFGTRLNLSALDLTDNRLDDDTGSILLAHLLPLQTNLEKLTLEENRFTDIGWSTMVPALAHLENLREVNLRRNCLSGKYVDSGDALTLPPQVERIDLSENTGLGRSKGLIHLIGSNLHVHAWQLESVDLQDEGLANLCRVFQHCEQTKLRSLSLKQNAFGRQGMEALVALLQTTSLKVLNISSCVLNNDHIACLAPGLRHHPTLETLGLAFNHFDNTGCRILAETAARMPALSSLDIQFAKFDQEGLAYFLPTLQANPVLDHFSYWSFHSLARQAELSHWVDLNCAGRRIVMDESFPVNLLPNVLERAHRVGRDTALYYLIRQCLPK